MSASTSSAKVRVTPGADPAMPPPDDVIRVRGNVQSVLPQLLEYAQKKSWFVIEKVLEALAHDSRYAGALLIRGLNSSKQSRPGQSLVATLIGYGAPGRTIEKALEFGAAVRSNSTLKEPTGSSSTRCSTLHLALARNRVDVIPLLLHYGQGSLDENSNGETATEYFVRLAHPSSLNDERVQLAFGSIIKRQIRAGITGARIAQLVNRLLARGAWDLAAIAVEQSATALADRDDARISRVHVVEWAYHALRKGGPLGFALSLQALAASKNVFGEAPQLSEKHTDVLISLAAKDRGPAQSDLSTRVNLLQVLNGCFADGDVLKIVNAKATRYGKQSREDQAMIEAELLPGLLVVDPPSLLQLAIKDGLDVALVRGLLELGASPTYATTVKAVNGIRTEALDGSAMHIAAGTSSHTLAYLEVLTEFGGRLDQQNAQGLTPVQEYVRLRQRQLLIDELDIIAFFISSAQLPDRPIHERVDFGETTLQGYPLHPILKLVAEYVPDRDAEAEATARIDHRRNRAEEYEVLVDDGVLGIDLQLKKVPRARLQLLVADELLEKFGVTFGDLLKAMGRGTGATDQSISIDDPNVRQLVSQLYVVLTPAPGVTKEDDPLEDPSPDDDDELDADPAWDDEDYGGGLAVLEDGDEDFLADDDLDVFDTELESDAEDSTWLEEIPPKEELPTSEPRPSPLFTTSLLDLLGDEATFRLLDEPLPARPSIVIQDEEKDRNFPPGSLSEVRQLLRGRPSPPTMVSLLGGRWDPSEYVAGIGICLQEGALYEAYLLLRSVDEVVGASRPAPLWAFTKALRTLLFRLPPGVMNYLGVRLEFSPYVQQARSGSHPQMAELMALLNHPLDQKRDEDSLGGLTLGITAVDRLITVGELHGQVVSIWDQCGTLNFCFPFWRFDTQGLDSADPDSATLFEKAGIQRIFFDKTEYWTDPKTGKREHLLGPIFVVYPGGPFHKAFDHATAQNLGFDKLLPDTWVVFRRACLVIYHPRFGCLLIRNSSLVFGRDRFSEPAMYYGGTLSVTQLVEMDQEFVEKHFLAITKRDFVDAMRDRRAGIGPWGAEAKRKKRERQRPFRASLLDGQIADPIEQLLGQFRTVRTSYARKKFDTHMKTAWNERNELVGGFRSPLFPVVLDLLEDRMKSSRALGKDLSLVPDLEVHNPYFPPFAAHASLRLTDRVLEILRHLSAHGVGGLSQRDLTSTGIRNFMDVALLKGGNSELICAPRRDT